MGLYEDIGQPEYDAQGNKIPGVKWVEGVAIIVAIVIVVTVGSVNDFQKEKQFRKLNAKKEDRTVKVIYNACIPLCIFKLYNRQHVIVKLSLFPFMIYKSGTSFI